jgi:hypothetical protein
VQNVWPGIHVSKQVLGYLSEWHSLADTVMITIQISPKSRSERLVYVKP